jgi:hypothetical protein
MPIDLSALAKDRREFEFEYGGMSMPVTYKPSVMTGRYAQSLADGETIDDLVGEVAKVIVDWDLVSEGEKVPVSPDALALLPTAMLTKMLGDISEDAGLAPKPTTENRATRRSRQSSMASNGTS